MTYTVSYLRHDKNPKGEADSKQTDSENMRQAVNKILELAKKHNVKISKISCKVKGSQGVQMFCDNCQVNYGMFGSKDKFLCRECKGEIF